MTKTLIFLFLSLFFLSCNSTPAREDCRVSAQQDNSEETAPCVLEPAINQSPSTPALPSQTINKEELVPTAASLWDAEIYYVNFNEAQQAKVEEAVALMKKVIASKAFMDRILNYTYQDQKMFHGNDGLTNAQIYQIILDGAEKIGTTSKNNRMDVELELYHATTNTIGYTYPNVRKIWMNTKYFDRYSPIQVAGNLTHEWMHKLGFGHDTTWSKSRDHTVPYAIGYIMEELAALHYKK